MKNTMNGQQVRKQIVHKIVERVYFRLESDIDYLIRNSSTQEDPNKVRPQVYQIREFWIRENVLEGVRAQVKERHDG